MRRRNLFFSDRFIRVWIIFIAIAITVVGLGYYWAGNTAESSLEEQTLLREQIIARAGAKAIENFFILTGSRLTTFSTRPSVVSMDPANLPEVLENFVDSLKGTPVVEAMVIDSDGFVRFLGNRGDSGFKEGINVSGRKYFQWAKEASSGEYFIGMPILPGIGAYEGRFLIPVATPIFDERGEFYGVFGVGILLDDLVNFYLNPLRISDQSQALLIDEKGVIVSAPNQKFIGTNVFDYFGSLGVTGKEDFLSELRVRFERKGEGKLSVILPDPTSGKERRHLIAYSPVSVGDETWSLVVSTPEEDAQLYLGPLTVTYTVHLTVVISIIIILSIFLILIYRYSQRDAFLKGFVASRDHKGQKVKEERH